MSMPHIIDGHEVAAPELARGDTRGALLRGLLATEEQLLRSQRGECAAAATQEGMCSGATVAVVPEPSMATSKIEAISLTTKAMRYPTRFWRMCFSSVVLPAPRNPERTVTGKRAEAAEFFAASLSAVNAALASDIA